VQYFGITASFPGGERLALWAEGDAVHGTALGQGSLIMEIFGVNFVGSASVNQFEHFVTLAVAKIRS
jgi:hypothetical protein